MSASYNQTNFDDQIANQYNSSSRHIPKASYQSTPNHRVPSHSASVHVAKDVRNDFGTPNSTESSGPSHAYNGVSSNGIPEWADDFAPNAQDPPEGQLLPGPPGIARRAKAHVPSACVNCKKKHLACETKRPCNRCVQNGKESSCVDVQHKKRGRPRLREDDSFRDLNLGSGSSYGDGYQANADIMPAPQPGRHRSKAYRELRSQPETTYVDRRPRTSDSSYQQNPYAGPLLDYATSTASYRPSNVPTVLLTPDFVVAQHNRAFTDALLLPIAARGQTLQDLVVPAEREKIRRLQALMRAEYHNVIQSARRHGGHNTIDTMPSIDQLDIVRATSGFQTRSEYWTFRLPRDQSRGYPICISLARNGGHFVVLTLIQSANALQPLSSPSLLQQTMIMPAPSMDGIPSPPNSLYQSQPSRQHRHSPSDMGISYFPPGTSFEDQLMPPHPAQSLAQYNATSPPRSVQMPYATPRTNSSSSASVTGSDIPRSSPSNSNQPLPRDSLKHLQLPPILTGATPTSDPSTPRDSHRRRHGTSTPSPARNSPHNGKRKKRRRVEIVDMLH